MTGENRWDLADLLMQSRRVLVFSGAGISTESGIADFRGPQGLWTRRRPVYFEQFLRSEVARIEYWDQKLEAWPSIRSALPNAVHRSAVALERAGKLAMVVTQNIDGLHARAGTSEDRLVELHGTNGRVACLRCHQRSDPEPHLETFRKTRKPPRCSCGGWLKPATISFGQSLREEDLSRARSAAETADLVVALGSTLSVYPAAAIPLLAAERGVPYVIINRGETDHDGHPAVTLRLEGNVTEIFPPTVVEALAEAEEGRKRS